MVLVGQLMLINVLSPQDEEHEISLSLSDILVFGTRSSSEPHMGFQPNPKIAFSNWSHYLKANTYTNTIFLPREELSYETLIFR